MPRHRTVLTFAVAIACLAIGASVVAIAIDQQARAWEWVLHTRENLERLQAARARLGEAVVEQRDYMLTRAPGYLQRLDTARHDLETQAHDFAALTADNPRQQEASRQLARRLDEYLSDLRAVAVEATGGRLDPQSLEQNRPRLEAVQALLARMRGEEERLLAQRNGDVDRARALTIAAVGGFCLLALLLMAYIRHVVTLDGKRIRELASQRQLALDAAELGWWGYDPAARQYEFDARSAKILGIHAGRVTAPEVTALLEPDDATHLAEEFAATLDPRRRERYQVQVRIRRPDQQQRWVEVHGDAVYAGGGAAARAVAVVGTVADITSRKAAEAALADLNRSLEQRVHARTRELEEANAEMEAFTYSVSHDLRAPLRGIHGYAQALEEDFLPALDAQARQYLQRIAASAGRMDDLIQDLLEYSRLGRDEMRLGVVELEAVVAAALLELKSVIGESGASVDVQGPLPPVVGARPILLQVVQNMVGNAIKFVPRGTQPEVRIHAESRDGRVRLWVEDNGIGIEARHQERIFRVFERLHGADVYPGTGVGLAIVRKGMERMRGRCGVDSAPGAGSRFWIELPRAQGASA